MPILSMVVPLALAMTTTFIVSYANYRSDTAVMKDQIQDLQNTTKSQWQIIQNLQQSCRKS